MDRELWAALSPPPNGLNRLRDGLPRRAARSRRRVIAVAAPLVALALVWRLTPTASTPSVGISSGSAYDPSLHPALAVLDGAPLPTVALRDQPGELITVPTADSAIVLVLHDTAGHAPSK